MSPNKTTQAQQAQPDTTFSESLNHLENILTQFKSGSLALEESLELFEQGVGHLKNCQAQLTKARGQVEVLVKTMSEAGEAMTQPFEE